MKCLLCNQELPAYLTLRELILPIRLERDCLCQDCRQSFQPYRLTDPHCEGCGRKLAKKQLCTDCQYWKQRYGWFLVHRPLYEYNEAMALYMRQYKFQGNYTLRQVFCQTVHQTLQTFDYDLLVPIPVSRQTFATRGFNQVIGMIESERYVEALAVQQETKEQQSAKTRQERLQTQQPFELQVPHALAGQRVLLIDDVYTTGRTLYHAAELCQQAGCKNVKSLSLAR